MLNPILFNWASSIVDCYGVQMKKKFYPDVKRLYKQFSSQNDEEIVLIPGINLFKNGPFKYQHGNNLVTSLFAYKEHIYLNSDRFVDETEEVFNEIQFSPASKLFESCGRFVSGFHHEEVVVTLTNRDWTMSMFNLCREIECLPKGVSTPSYTLKYELDMNLMNFCQIDQVGDADIKFAYRQMKANKKISDENYMKAQGKCVLLLKEFLRRSGKTTIEADLRDLVKGLYKDNRDLVTLRYSLSQKKIVNHHIKLFQARMIKEFQGEVFGNIRSNYI